MVIHLLYLIQMVNMLCGHIDEIGLMVNYINDEGYIYISKIGGIEDIILSSQRVIIHSKNGPVNGVIGRRPLHLSSPDDKEVKIHTLFVDIGAKDKEDALKLVTVGDIITLDVSYCELANNIITARGLDDRTGAWVVAQVLKKLTEKNIYNIKVIGVATVQEENGLLGAQMVSNINPNIALAIDVTHATDVPDIPKEKHGECKLGGGPVLSIGSSIHKKVNEILEQAAQNTNISIQKQISPNYTGTDADSIFTKCGGIPTALVSIPNRYMHSSVELIQLDDLENAVKLIVEFCELLDKKTDCRF